MSRRDDVLVDGAWVQERLGGPQLVIVEVDERSAIYREGHIPGARSVDARRDLQDPVTRDVPGPEATAALWSRLGIDADVTVVLYGDKSNWYACFGFWLFRLYGLRRLRLLDGGRQAWLAEGRPLTRDAEASPPAGGTSGVVPRWQPHLRAGFAEVAAASADGGQLLDVRTPSEFRGELLAEPGYPQEAAQRAGHIPAAISLPWDALVGSDGRILSDERLHATLAAHGVTVSAPAITYCRIGERSAHTWFVLHEVLGVPASNYDGSWAEWGSMIGMPIAVGE